MKRSWLLPSLLVAICVTLSGCGKSQLSALGGNSVEHWVTALQDPDAKMRAEAATKLGSVGSSDPTVVPALIGALKDKSSQVRREAILSLSKSGRAALEAIGSLTELQKHDQDPKVRELATRGIKRLQRSSGAANAAGST
ncbi:MAG TPA: HEAT repeat domain-containing protein [Lacipirellulaceae bacterium]|jgi:vesicle coat complex subunit